MGGHTCNPGSFVGEAGVVDVQKGGKIFSAALTVHCRVLRLEMVQVSYHTVMQLVRILSVAL